MADFVELRSSAEFEEFVAEGRNLVFKHSSSCSISFFVKQDVETVPAKIGLIVVQNARPVSAFVAKKTGIRHESPQALFFENGECIYHASHYDISSDRIKELLNG